MRQPFFEDLMTAMYPSGLLHTFGVNGKISGSVGAVGEMQEVLPLLHSPRGCGFHYRYSARRRHQPFYSVLTSNLEERDIICGGEEKLRQAIRDAWSRYRPGLIMVIPSPISDILNEDVRSVCAELRREGISVVGVQSELFSHRDKNYTRNRLKELAHQTITGDNRLEMELKGCGFTEALYALVEQVMEPSAQIPHSINIETVGWGSEGKAALRELEVFLNGCGIQVNTWIPSAPLSSLVHAPAAELNLVKRVRWARACVRNSEPHTFTSAAQDATPDWMESAPLPGHWTGLRMEAAEPVVPGGAGPGPGGDGGGPPPPGAGRAVPSAAASSRLPSSSNPMCGTMACRSPSLCHPDPGEP
ncbi:MAG: nitrogenase component 1 [Flavonifractor plautii]